MENTQENRLAALALLAKAKGELMDDMKERGIAAVLWNNSSSGFHYIPEIYERPSENENHGEVCPVIGLYVHGNDLYAIEECSKVNLNDFYNRDSEVAPTIVTLTEDSAAKYLGDPSDRPGFTTSGSIAEWLTIADCYFEAIAMR